MASVYETYLRRYLNDDGRLWTSEQIERWAMRAEIEICRIAPAVITREQLPIINEVPLYVVPATPNFQSLGINQITYKGNVLTALSLQAAHELFPHAVIIDQAAAFGGGFEPSAFDNDAFFVFKVNNESVGPIPHGRPEYWWYAGYHEDQIQLYPTPNESIDYNAGAGNLWGNEIPNYCIIEYRTVSYGTAGDQKPLWRFVRALIRDYVLSEAFAIEGKGQQIREAVMLKKRFNARLNTYKALSHNVFVANKHAFGSQTVSPVYTKFQLNYGSDIGIRVRR
jgi:hypothetical protein